MTPNLSRRDFITAALLAATSTRMQGTAGFAQQSAAGGDEPWTLVNGRIHTLDDANRVVDSVVIRNGRFASLGPGAATAGRIVDLNGRTVIPGLIDNHTHFVRIGNLPGYDARALEAAFTVSSAQKVIAQRAAGAAENGFITALAGLARRQFAERRFPTMAELDDAAPRHPVVISELMVGQTNTLGRDALRGLGVAVGDQGVVQNQNLVFDALAKSVTHVDRKRQLLDTARYSLSIGLTTVMDMHGSTPGAGFLDRVTGHDALLDLVREGSLDVRTRLFFAEQNDVNQLQAILDTRWREFGSDMCRVAGIGEWAPRGASYQESLKRMAAREWIYHQHLISADEIQTHLDNFERFEMQNRGTSLAELHWNLGHVGDITPGQVERANKLGVGLAPHPWRYLTANNGGPAFRTIVSNAKVPVGAGLDGARVAPLNPWAGIYFMVTGRNSGGALVNDGERISRQDALRLYAGPQQGWFTREEKVLGGIGVGRFADLAVLSKNVFDEREVPDEEIRTMNSILTVVGGRIVYNSGELGLA
ncbi:MAG TPA: amidohydrolase family protein [Terriglobia bacterium]|nr:amidohydrolase family protein [Terriglobia bacterium]